MALAIKPPVFAAELRPHRSLGARGFLILMLAVGAVNFTAGIAFWIAGAWPVFGFCGLEVLLLWLAFRASYRQSRAREYIQLDQDSLTVCRRDAKGAERVWRLQPYWLRVECADDDEQARLKIWSHGRALSLGEFLSPDERRSLADALREALWRWRQPEGAGLRPIGQV
ncbi:DUF2244 domain-containing protein [uncultured Ferrovibrio sp.]|jgi:uncharacterized membrane protein|uniref:DUF2244 domain-containing protein n=1 Tax=uncultured Ferrovibrio sp. TaxID=1576913 RepID=UPI0026098968|nr:DUF2244 domain-containing protein [uncultured Ferrovibrio sp.]